MYFLANAGASTENDCLACPAGKWCHKGDPIPDLCPVGHYCSALNGSCPGGDPSGPQPCPLYTYRDIEG